MSTARKLYLLIQFILLISVSCCYYLSQTRLNWNLSSTYCQSHCSSELGSIHNSVDMNFAMKTSNDSSSKHYYPSALDVWIGLNDIYDDDNFTWIDGTPLDYGNIYGSGPWLTSQPLLSTDNHCIAMDNNYINWNWTSAVCTQQKRALCNHCDSELTKYIGATGQYLNYTQAATYCHSTFNTHLASIHSARDMIEAQTLCKLLNDNGADNISCYIGLHDLNNRGENNFTWYDKTTLDFGSIFGEYPWQHNKPMNVSANQECIMLNAEMNYLWIDVACDQKGYFICNIPSEIGVLDTDWFVAPVHDFLFVNTLSLDSVTGTNDFFGVIKNKQWDNHGDELLIEYLLTIHHFYGHKRGTIGVLLYNMESLCEYFYIGIICKLDGLNCDLFIRKYTNDTYDILNENRQNININLSVTYLLSIRVTNNRIDVFFKNVTVSANIDGLLPTTDLSGYIGLKSEQMMFTGKSLYVSGTPIINSSNLFVNDHCNMTYQPILLNTTEPTMAPTTIKPPSISATTKPPFGIEYGVVITITFIYESNTNITNNVIQLLLTNITQNFINDDIVNNIDENCLLSDNYNINTFDQIINVNQTHTMINATIFVCDQDTETTLSAGFSDNNLETDFVDKIENDLIVITVKGGVQIESTPIIKGISDANTTTLQIEETDRDDLEEKNNDNAILITIYVMIGLFVVCIFGVLLWRFIQHKKYKEKCNNNGTDSERTGEQSGKMEMTDIELGNAKSISSVSYDGHNQTAIINDDDSNDEMYATKTSTKGDNVEMVGNMSSYNDAHGDDIDELFVQSPSNATKTFNTMYENKQDAVNDNDSEEEIYRNTTSITSKTDVGDI